MSKHQASPPPSGGGDDTYTSVSHQDHISLRPDMYIGPVKTVQWENALVLSGNEVVLKECIDVLPAVVRIFDELIINAADNKMRDDSTTQLKVDMDGGNGRIRVWNNGGSIPVRKHDTEDEYIPVMVFGKLLTGSNFDDTKSRITGGRNGYGAKLANIFSTAFTIRIADGTSVLTAKWINKMTTLVSVTVRPCKKQFTEVTMMPNYSYFGLNPQNLPNDLVAIMRRRVYDVCGCTPPSMKVFLNGQKLPFASFEGYCALCAPFGSAHRPCVDTSVPRWDVCVAFGDHPIQMSWVNNIWTRKGGTHVAYVLKSWLPVICDLVKRRCKEEKVAVPARLNQFVKARLCVAVSATVDNPTFDGQCKEELTTSAAELKAHPYTLQTTPKLLRTLGTAGGAVDKLVEALSAREGAQLSKLDGKKKRVVRGIDGLFDAKHAGTKRASECYLYLTEGKSAAALAVGARTNPATEGVLALRGKIANVMNASNTMIANNRELQNIREALGLKSGRMYTKENISELRYGHVVFMTDQDTDGFHIKGLCINLVFCLWPSLLQLDGFLGYLQTPIVKARHKNKPTVEFFSTKEYDNWKTTITDLNKWTIKYYKGLGTNTTAEGKTYFQNPARYLVWLKQDEEAADMVQLAFDKRKTNERKRWMSTYSTTSDAHADRPKGMQTVSRFFRDEFIHHPMENVGRMIPGVDGFKDCQRKVMWTMLQKEVVKDYKVAQLAPAVAHLTGYTHGEDNLNGTIIGMGQDFTGSNNLPLVMGIGQFGSRLENGHDHASARYICTRLYEHGRALFPKSDFAILERRREDGVDLEPQSLLPVAPNILMNGQDGIATGWSTSIPGHDPIAVIDNTERLVRGRPLLPMCPWYRGFLGEVRVDDASSSYTTEGVATWDGHRSMQITELPIGVSIAKYKQTLDKLIAKGTQF